MKKYIIRLHSKNGFRDLYVNYPSLTNVKIPADVFRVEIMENSFNLIDVGGNEFLKYSQVGVVKQNYYIGEVFSPKEAVNNGLDANSMEYHYIITCGFNEVLRSRLGDFYPIEKDGIILPSANFDELGNYLGGASIKAGV